MKTLASLGSDIRAIPVWIKTEFDKEDVVWGIRIDGTENQVVIRDVSMFAYDIAYEDIILVEEKNNKHFYIKHLQKSDWISFVILTQTIECAAKIGAKIINYPENYEIAARFIPGEKNIPILGISIKKSKAKNLLEDIKIWKENKYINDYAETTELSR